MIFDKRTLARNLGRAQWTHDEDATLTKAYEKRYDYGPAYTIEEIAEVLPGRSIQAIRTRASRLGLRRPELVFEEVTT